MAFKPPTFNYGNSGGAFFGIIAQAMANRYRQTPGAAFGQQIYRDSASRRHAQEMQAERIAASRNAQMEDIYIQTQLRQAAGELPSTGMLNLPEYKDAVIPVHDIQLPLVGGVDPDKMRESFTLRIPDAAAMRSHLADQQPWSGPKRREDMTRRDWETIQMTGGPNSPLLGDMIIDRDVLDATIAGIRKIAPDLAQQMEVKIERDGFMTLNEMSGYGQATKNAEVKARLDDADEQLRIGWANYQLGVDQLELTRRNAQVATQRNFGHKYSVDGAHLGAVPEEEQAALAELSIWASQRDKHLINATTAALFLKGRGYSESIAKKVASDWTKYEYDANPPTARGSGGDPLRGAHLLMDDLRSVTDDQEALQDLYRSGGLGRNIDAFRNSIDDMEGDMRTRAQDDWETAKKLFKEKYNVELGEGRSTMDEMAAAAANNRGLAEALAMWTRLRIRNPGDLHTHLRRFFLSGMDTQALPGPETVEAYKDLLIATGARWDPAWQAGMETLQLFEDAAMYAASGYSVVTPLLAQFLTESERTGGETDSEATEPQEGPPPNVNQYNPFAYAGGSLGDALQFSGPVSGGPQLYGVGEMDREQSNIMDTANARLRNMVRQGLSEPEILELAADDRAMWSSWATTIQAAAWGVGPRSIEEVFEDILTETQRRAEARWNAFPEDDNAEEKQALKDLRLALTTGPQEDRLETMRKWLTIQDRLNEMLYNYARSGKMEIGKASEDAAEIDRATRERQQYNASIGEQLIRPLGGVVY